jgi:ribosomal protein S18 acetylase RimI-like enzyme
MGGTVAWGPMDFSIRVLTVDDAVTIAPVHVRSWQAAYRGLMDQAMLDSLRVEDRIELWQRQLAGPNPGTRLIVESDGEVVGFAVGMRASAGEDRAAEVYSIYLDPSVWRAGIGSALLDEAVAELRSDAPTPVILWVVEGNDRACRFYESRGWYFDGGRKDEPIGDQLVPHVRYRLD